MNGYTITDILAREFELAEPCADCGAPVAPVPGFDAWYHISGHDSEMCLGTGPVRPEGPPEWELGEEPDGGYWADVYAEAAAEYARELADR